MDASGDNADLRWPPIRGTEPRNHNGRLSPRGALTGPGKVLSVQRGSRQPATFGPTLTVFLLFSQGISRDKTNHTMQQIQKTVCGQAKWNVAGTRPCSECERSSFASSNKSIIFYGRGGRGLPLEFADLTPLFAIGGFVLADPRQ